MHTQNSAETEISTPPYHGQPGGVLIGKFKTGAGFQLKNKNGPFSAVSKPIFASK